MTSNLANNAELTETAKTWHKFSESAKKAGFRDGVTKGRDQSFQESFDKGYVEGFKNGFVIGKYKGALKAASIQTGLPNEIDSDLEHSRRGWCQLCKDNSLLQTNIDEIKDLQMQFSNTLLKNLCDKYSLQTNVTLPNKID